MSSRFRRLNMLQLKLKIKEDDKRQSIYSYGPGKEN
jgi:hypothetical protein